MSPDSGREDTSSRPSSTILPRRIVLFEPPRRVPTGFPTRASPARSPPPLLRPDLPRLFLSVPLPVNSFPSVLLPLDLIDSSTPLAPNLSRRWRRRERELGAVAPPSSTVVVAFPDAARRPPPPPRPYPHPSLLRSSQPDMGKRRWGESTRRSKPWPQGDAAMATGTGRRQRRWRYPPLRAGKAEERRRRQKTTSPPCASYFSRRLWRSGQRTDMEREEGTLTLLMLADRHVLLQRRPDSPEKGAMPGGGG